MQASVQGEGTGTVLHKGNGRIYLGTLQHTTVSAGDWRIGESYIISLQYTVHVQLVYWLGHWTGDQQVPYSRPSHCQAATLGKSFSSHTCIQLGLG